MFAPIGSERINRPNMETTHYGEYIRLRTNTNGLAGARILQAGLPDAGGRRSR